MTNKLKILIVDDNELDRENYKRHLEKDPIKKYDFIEASEGEEVVELYKNHKPDCILLDYLLPDMDGLEILDALKVEYKYLPVVMLTGGGDDKIAEKAIDKGAQDYLVKSSEMRPESLQRAVKNTIERMKLLKKLEVSYKEILLAKEAAEQAQERAEEANKLKTAFLANMSHEMRTPLNGVIGMLELLLQKDVLGEEEKYVQTAKKSADSLLYLICDILDFSKIESGKFALENTSFDLKSITEEVIEVMEVESEKQKTKIILNCNIETPKPVIGDSNRIRQILFNLIGNAVKFTKEGSVTINIGGKKEN